VIRIGGSASLYYEDDDADADRQPSYNYLYDSGDDCDYSPMNEVIRRHPYRRRKNPPTANTSVIESSPISLELRGAGGFKRVKLDDGRYSCRPVNVSGLLRRREFKSSSCRGGLSKSDCCTITANYLPNTKTTIKRFQSRLFGGLFSEDGTVFMSSCQGLLHKVFIL
jgi:hypothetical protein